MTEEERKSKDREKSLRYYYRHHEANRLRSREWNRKNRAACRAAKNAWHARNRDHVREYERMRRADPVLRIRKQLGIRMNEVLSYKGAKKAAKTMQLLGCDVIAFKAHLESLWLSGMTWENYGYRGWHIDHIRPCASFDLTDPEQQRACFHYTNLRPLWANANMAKSDMPPEEWDARMADAIEL